MEEENNEYRWESGYEKTWEAITEDADGLIELSVQELIQKARRKRMMEKTGKVKLGMMRYVYLVVDMSDCMQLQDIKPTRLLCTLKLLESFVDEFFYLNPISQLGIITTRNKRAEIISELGGNPRKHTQNLKKMSELTCGGEPSLQNSLETALQSLRHMPNHASREIIVLLGSLTTCDPGDIHATIDNCKSSNVRCSVISLTAEVRIYRKLTKVTGGDFSVILDDTHFRDILNAQLEPPPCSTQAEASLIKMGFPTHTGQDDNDPRTGLGMCFCHLDTTPKLSMTGFLCPQCNAKYCELPVECQTCGLTLVSAPHLARSYHHLFPLPPFSEITLEQSIKKYCFACIRSFEKKVSKPTVATVAPPLSSTGAAAAAAATMTVYECPNCHQTYCCDCDIFIHETLHSCPGCASMHQSTSANGVS